MSISDNRATPLVTLILMGEPWCYLAHRRRLYMTKHHTAHPDFKVKEEEKIIKKETINCAQAAWEYYTGHVPNAILIVRLRQLEVRFQRGRKGCFV
ncbi:hypothetical protein OnM2_003020 [Erysiphe neolycopersici]|uniref:Uncharacterized protein n=1 Tax=Erysiphe neolycopersici TaxID=212602 RepID=A0A420I7Z9_9PEZI|nr:hypothetical protein OnM2_003020 [Erysiphe neolycopersici]